MLSLILYLDDTQLNSQNIGSGLDDVTMTHYNLSGLTPNTTYKFRVIANSATGTTWGHWVSFTTTENSVTPPTLDPTPRITGWGEVRRARHTTDGQGGRISDPDGVSKGVIETNVGRPCLIVKMVSKYYRNNGL